MTRKINPKSLENLKKGKKFTPGDPRINRLGRASNFDQLRALFQSIANEEIKEEGENLTRLRKIAETMASDKKMMKDFLEFGFGKVPIEVQGDLTGDMVFRHVYDDEPRVTNSPSEKLPSKPDGSDSK